MIPEPVLRFVHGTDDLFVYLAEGYRCDCDHESCYYRWQECDFEHAINCDCPQTNGLIHFTIARNEGYEGDEEWNPEYAKHMTMTPDEAVAFVAKLHTALVDVITAARPDWLQDTS